MVSPLLKKSVVAGAITVALDYIFHYSFTTPQESVVYYFVKFLIASTIAYLLFSKFDVSKQSVLASSVFALIFSLYYRFNEYFYGAGFGSRVPEITLLGQTYAFQTQPVLSGLLWGLVHGVAFYIGIQVSKKV